MKKLLTNNLALKILSVIIGILIWYIVVSINDPIVTEYFNDIPVTTVNDSYIKNEKRTFRISEQYETVRVAIRDNKSKVKEINASDITVTADMTQIVDIDQNPVYVPLQVECAGISSDNISTARTTIPVELEQIEQETLPVSTTAGQTKPDKRFEIGKLTSDPQSLTVSGPASTIKKIGSIVATVDVSGMAEDGVKNAELKILDKNGDVFSDSTFENLTFEGLKEGEKPNIEVTVELWKKVDVRLEAEYSGTPANGYQVSEVKVVPSELTIAGSAEALEGLAESGNTLTIPGSMVDISGATGDVEAAVELEEILPEKTKLISSTDGSDTVVKNATVKVSVLENESKEYSLDMANIEKRNIASDLVITYGQPNVTVRIKASDSLLEKLSAADLEKDAYLDLANKAEGDYTVNLNFDLAEGYELVSQVTAKIHLEKAVDENKTGT